VVAFESSVTKKSEFRGHAVPTSPLRKNRANSEMKMDDSSSPRGATVDQPLRVPGRGLERVVPAREASDLDRALLQNRVRSPHPSSQPRSNSDTMASGTGKLAMIVPARSVRQP